MQPHATFNQTAIILIIIVIIIMLLLLRIIIIVIIIKAISTSIGSCLAVHTYKQCVWNIALTFMGFITIVFTFFSRMRSEGFSFYTWGLTRVRVTLLLASATVRNRSQPFARVRNRPSAAVVASKLLCLWKKSKKRNFFDVSEDVVMLFFVAGVAPRGIPTCFKTVKKDWCGRHFCYIFRRCVAFFVAGRSTLDTSDVILRGRRSTLDMSCCVFSANRIVSAARSGDKVQIPWQAWHFVTCHENRRKPRTKRRFCSRSI